MKRITTKKRMYELLSGGFLGNTIPQWFDLEQWKGDPLSMKYPSWGVRTMVPGGPCRLYCPKEEVEETATRPEFVAAGVNISIMIDATVNVSLYADVYDSPHGRLIRYVEYPAKGASWRKEMPSKGKDITGLSAKMLLRKHLNPSSLSDLEAVLENFPGHVVELSACEGCFGTVPGRNAVVWECRDY